MDNDFYTLFYKLVDNSTTLLESPTQRITIGLYIDIFPIDGCCDDFKQQKRIIKRLKTEYYSMFRESTLNFGLRDGFQKLKQMKVKYFIRSLLISVNRNFFRNWAYKKIHKQLSKYKYDNSKYVMSSFGGYGIKEIMRKDVFGKGTIADFEGMDVIIPENNDEYLRNLYGDYMTLPPMSKQKSHHNVSYENYDIHYELDELRNNGCLK